MDNMEHQQDSVDLGGDTDVTETTAVDITDTVSEDWDAVFAETDMPTAAEQAADYARSLGHKKAADYISRHYEGGEFSPEEPIPVSTRNMKLEGDCSENGIPL